MTFGETIQILGLLGGIAGATTLIWRLIDVRRAYLHISLTVEDIGALKVKLRTEVRNHNTVPRKIDGAFLVIGPASDGPEDTIITLFKRSNDHTDFSKLRDVVRAVTTRFQEHGDWLTDGEGRMIVPLTYYYIENIDVADEELSFEQIVDCTRFPPGAYAARFYIEGIPWLHRVVHASFEVAAQIARTPKSEDGAGLPISPIC